MKRTSRAQKSSGPWPVALERRRDLDVPSAVGERIHELEELACKLIRTHEERQRFISSELHDNIAQGLLAATARLELLAKTKLPASARLELAKIRADLETTLNDLRTLSRKMRPDTVDHLGLAAVLENHSRSFRERTSIGLELEIAVKSLDHLAGEQVAGLFRIAQEALHNVEKHSAATQARIKLHKAGGHLLLEIADNGKSFGPEHVRQAQVRGRIGLFSMRERAKMLGGNLTIDTRPGYGTTVCAAIPLPEDRRRANNARKPQ